MEFIKESEFNKYTDFTKEAIEGVKTEMAEMKEIQESIIEQNDSIVDEYSNADFKAKFDSVEEKLSAIEKWADHVKDEFDTLKESKEGNGGKELDAGDETVAYHVGDEYEGKVIRAVEKTDDGKTSLYFEDEDEPMIMEAQAPLAKADALQVGTDYKGKGTITAVEVQDDGSTKVFIDSTDEPIIVGKTKVDDVINDDTLQEKYDALEAKFDAMVKWSNHVTETVSALENWSDHSTETVSTLEENAKTVEKWSEHVTESVSALENKTENTKAEKINESSVDDFKASIYNKLESILEAKEQKATDNESLNESENVDLNEAKDEAPLWLQLIPAKYNETWNGLEESEKTRITKRASLFNFVNESSIKDFWNNEFTKENLIKEDKTEDKEKLSQDQITEARLAKLRGFRMV